MIYTSANKGSQREADLYVHLLYIYIREADLYVHLLYIYIYIYILSTGYIRQETKKSVIVLGFRFVADTYRRKKLPYVLFLFQ